jgi:Restriction endonuclease
MNLQEELERLELIKSPHRRGRLFETFLAQMLEEEGFNVTTNPKAATPRQTDLSAERESIFFLIEAKWLKKPATSDSVSGMRERLRKAHPSVFGCIFSMSGYSSGATQEILSERSQEIFLFNENEIRGIASSELSFDTLLQEKRRELRTNASVWFSNWSPRATQAKHLRAAPCVIREDGETRSWVRCSTVRDDVVFSSELLDLDTYYSGSGMSLRLSANITSADELGRLLRMLQKQLKLAGDDSFAIHQRNTGWYGFGAERLISAIKKWEARYADLGLKSYHHSEEIAYLDRLEYGGLMCITTRQRVGEHVYLHSSEIEIWTPGMPVDMAAITRICEATKNEGAVLERLPKRPVLKHTFHPRVAVKPVAFISHESAVDGDWTSGIIVENPFFGKSVVASDGTALQSPLSFLSNNELLICKLRHWHPANAHAGQYELWYVEACWIDHMPAFYIACDWR